MELSFVKSVSLQNANESGEGEKKKEPLPEQNCVYFLPGLVRLWREQKGK